jgi:PRTRC genetic system ThiF family protein
MLHTPKSWFTAPVKVLVVGAGGTGSEMLSRLYKMDYLLQKLGGDGFHVTLADPDHVSEFNLGRQSFYFSDINSNKAEVLISRLNAFTETQWHYFPKKMTMDFRYEDFDLVISCVDSASFRFELGKAYQNVNTDTLWLDGGNGFDDGQVVMGHLGRHSEKVPNVFDLMGDELEVITDDRTESCSTENALKKQTFGINSQIAEVMGQMLWQLMRFSQLDRNIAYVDLKQLTTTSVLSEPEQWSLYGYQGVGENKEAA